MKQARVLLIGLVMLLAGPAYAVSINFDDGTSGAPVGAFYSALGVTFSNAEWISNFGSAGSSGTLGIRALDNGVGLDNKNQWLEAHAVVATFLPDVFEVGIVGYDVGGNGITMKAYDSFVGGALLDSETFFGQGLGTGQFFTVSSFGPAIKRVEIFQASVAFNDGIGLDNLTFSPVVAAVPEPSATVLFGIGVLAASEAVRRRRP